MLAYFSTFLSHTHKHRLLQTLRCVVVFCHFPLDEVLGVTFSLEPFFNLQIHTNAHAHNYLYTGPNVTNTCFYQTLSLCPLLVSFNTAF